jgi:hypothetical protein
LNASANVPGILTYSPLSGTTLNAGENQTLSVDFAPTDETNYNSVYGTSVLITVNKATPVITWSNPADILENTALSATQLNATADIPGTFTYTPPNGTIMSAGVDQPLYVLFSPDDALNYNNAEKTVLITVTVITDVEYLNKKVITVYPNPAKGILTISGLAVITNDQIVRLSISDDSGKTFMLKNLEKNISSETIDISSFANGVYFIILQTDKEKIVKRFVKQ